MSDYEFKTNDDVEYLADSSSAWEKGIYAGKTTLFHYPHIVWHLKERRMVFVEEVRNPLQKIHPGQPIVVWDEGDKYKCIRYFSCFNDEGGMSVNRVNYTDALTENWDHYELLEHYDYTEGGKYPAE